ncbi:helix-turn-helix domain-containing protein [Ileibacterium valens]|uniref:helix-turn-helix domain-containing protein n=1 Tax=Ileibacterium valens TaxID=1862668 RepID=UPI002353F410|nr:helix-turn-helix transcriptional regulator [Ileibacterium valens]
MNERQKKNLFLNIEYLLKRIGLKKADLETRAGYSPGYLSRFKNGDSNNLPSLSFVESLTKQLNIDFDILINTNIEHDEFSEEYVVKLLNKLINDTISGTLKWKSNCSFKKLKTIDRNSDDSLFYKKTVVIEMQNHPAIDEDGIPCEQPEEWDEEQEELGFKPLDNEMFDWGSDYSDAFISGEYHYCRINEDTLLSIIPIQRYVQNEDVLAWTDTLSMWIIGKSPELLIDDDEASKTVSLLLKKLERAINQSSLTLNKQNRKSLDEYLYGKEDANE